jgi:hypothetical protein
MLELFLHDYIGLAGVAITLLAYLFLQIGFFKIEDITYSFANALGALLILVSLVFSWNSSSVAIEICWFFISLYGIFKTAFARKKQVQRP